MSMPAHQWVVLALGVLLAALTVARAPGALRGHNPNMFIAHALITVVVLLTVDPVYLAVDTFLGGVNVANYLSHLCFPLIFLLGGRQVARSLGEPSLVRRVSGPAGVAIICLSLAGMTASFIAAGPMPTSMGLNDYRDSPAVILYKVFSYVYCAWVGLSVGPPLLRASRWAGRGVSAALLGLAMCAVTAIPVLHLAEFVVPGPARVLADVTVYLTIFMAAASLAAVFVSRISRRSEGRRSPNRVRRGQPSRSGY